MTLPAWQSLDDQAVATSRALAMDAVQKVGNGHPGTAMSLAPVAYTLFQRILKHDPANPNWIARDRFVLSCGHSSLTLYIQLYLSGYGVELSDLQSFQHLIPKLRATQSMDTRLVWKPQLDPSAKVLQMQLVWQWLLDMKKVY